MLGIWRRARDLACEAARDAWADACLGVSYAWAVGRAYWRWYWRVYLRGPTTVPRIDKLRSVDGRVDVRYRLGGRKYRIVLRGEDPTAALAAVAARSSAPRPGPRGVLAAEMRHCDGDVVDVTDRVVRYQGPCRDFHSGVGARVAALDMFPSDDPDELASQWTGLVVTCVDGVRQVRLDCPDVAAALGLAPGTNSPGTNAASRDVGPGARDGPDTRDALEGP